MPAPNLIQKYGLIAFVAVIAALIIVFIFRERSPFGSRNTSFAVGPKTEISRIELSDGKKSVVLEIKGDEWLVNEKYEVRKSAVLSLLKLFKEIKIKSPVTQKSFNDEVLGKGITPVKVRAFHGNRLVKSFIVYRTGTNLYGNIMKMRMSGKPYIVYVPGLEAEIGSFFNTDELFWQPYVLYNLLPSEISSIKLENFTDKTSSFSIANRKNHFTLSNADRDLSGWDTSRIIRYISYFTHVSFEAPATDSLLAEEDIERSDPLFRITVEKSSGATIILTLWERWIVKDGTRSRDTDRLWAKISDRDGLFIVRYVDIDPVLKKISYFFTG